MNRWDVELQGIVALLMHAYRGEQPSAVKAPRGKKTQADIDKRRKEDWLASAYYADGKGFHIPPECVEAALVSGAKKIRLGEDFKMAVAVEDDFIPLLIPDQSGKFSPASAPLESYYVPEHIDVRGVRIQKNRIDRCRPIFREWKLRFRILAEDGITRENVVTALSHCQLGDFRPRFGRFAINRLEEAK